MAWLIGAALVGAVIVAVAIRRARSEGRPWPGSDIPLIIGPAGATVLVSIVVTGLVLVGLVVWLLMLLPPVNDAVFGDQPRKLNDFARMCEDGGKGGGEPFPRAAAYEPGAGRTPHPWVAVENGRRAAYSSRGTETKEPAWGEKPEPGTVQLVACSVESGSVPGTEISCGYTDNPLGAGSATHSVEFSQGRYTVAVFEARTGDLVGRGTVEGDEDVECSKYVSAELTEPRTTNPRWEAYADLIAGLGAAPPGSRAHR
ncbi:hypothetical protein [Streptomyces lycii]|uniref:DUF4190 domain-containing protein n=1 Tax=Streptomyces lycii TaxID=2654337 RepID=A0ABQ7FPK7_9ACTN|nr:hypothetical protein [Streptomyces lycii]KAF4409192.1 hypothetical protein GCU69_10245 [Streptomyces lycii]